MPHLAVSDAADRDAPRNGEGGSSANRTREGSALGLQEDV